MPRERAYQLEFCTEASVAGEYSYAPFTEELLAACAVTTDERAAEAIARLAGFPVRKLLEELDFAFQPSASKRQLSELASCAFVERRERRPAGSARGR